MSSRPGTFQSLWLAMKTRRTASVALLSFSSGMPLGLVWIAIPDWLRDAGADIRVVGLITLAQLPWTFKLLWSPLMDRYRPPFGGRRRGWALIFQLVLFISMLALAGVGHHPDAPWVILALAFALALASASQDIAIDAYAVDVLRREEQGAVVGARIAVYRAAMFFAGALAITLAGLFSWTVVNVLLGIYYLPMMVVTWMAPEPRVPPREPKSLTDAVWQPFLGFLSRHRALEILAFVLLYKFADNLAQGLLRPFLVDKGYEAVDRGLGLGTIGLFTILAGTFLGGFLTNRMGLGHALWVFGFLQIFSNIGYVFVDRSEINRLLMYSAMGFESFTQGLGTGAFSVLLLRMTQKRFSATQYALFSGLFSLPRIVAGPIAGYVVYSIGWEPFFWITILAGIPGLVMLQRFVPLGTREPRFEVEPPRSGQPLGAGALWVRGVLGGGGGFVVALLISAALNMLESMRDGGRGIISFGTAVQGLLAPTDTASKLTLAGLLVLGVICGLMTAAINVARHGGAVEAAPDAADEAETIEAEVADDEPVPLIVRTIAVLFVAPPVLLFLDQGLNRGRILDWFRTHGEWWHLLITATVLFAIAIFRRRSRPAS